MTGVDKVFGGCAIVGGVLFFIRLALFFIGGAELGADVDADVDVDVDADFDVGEGVEGVDESYASFKLFSFQSVAAFFMMFGLVGLALRKEANVVEAWAILGAVVAGVFSFWVIGKIISLMKRLQSSGTMNLANAIGQEGSVYLTVPADGVGKVRVTVQDHLKVFNAVSGKGEDIKTGEQVTVVSVTGGNTLVVEKL